MSICKIKNITEVDSIQLFEHKDLLIGDRAGKFIVVDEDGIIYGRYLDFLKAQEHADILNGPIPTGFENLTTQQLIEKAEKLCNETEEFLRELK